MSESTRTIEELTESDYEFGFSTDLDTDIAPPGLDESVVRLISSKKDEPEWLLEWRLKAYEAWRAMEEPDWAKLEIAPIDYEAISYWAAPKQKPVLDSMDDVDPDIRDMFDKLGIPLHEQKMLSNVAVDAIVDSVSVTTTFKKTLLEAGVIFCSFSEAVRDYPELVREHLGSVVPVRDNFFAALNSAVFSDGSFCYIPKGVRCPMELSTYFRINSMNTGQFERTLIVAEDDSHVSTSRGARRRSATRTSCMQRSSSWSPRIVPRSSTPRCRTGTPVTRTASAVSTTSSPSEGGPTPTPRFLGLRWRPVRRSPGSTRA